MTVIVCVDDRGGVMFNGRRQSQDKALRDCLLRQCGERKLWMSAYSAKQFAGLPALHIHVSDNCLAQAGKEDFCFVEGMDLLPYEAKMDQLMIFRWNRVYPSDRRLDLQPGQDGWKLVRQDEFCGSSHEKISLEVYRK